MPSQPPKWFKTLTLGMLEQQYLLDCCSASRGPTCAVMNKGHTCFARSADGSDDHPVPCQPQLLQLLLAVVGTAAQLTCVCSVAHSKLEVVCAHPHQIRRWCPPVSHISRGKKERREVTLNNRRKRNILGKKGREKNPNPQSSCSVPGIKKNRLLELFPMSKLTLVYSAERQRHNSTSTQRNAKLLRNEVVAIQ